MRMLRNIIRCSLANFHLLFRREPRRRNGWSWRLTCRRKYCFTFILCDRAIVQRLYHFIPHPNLHQRTMKPKSREETKQQLCLTLSKMTLPFAPGLSVTSQSQHKQHSLLSWRQIPLTQHELPKCADAINGRYQNMRAKYRGVESNID